MQVSMHSNNIDLVFDGPIGIIVITEENTNPVVYSYKN